MQPTHIYHADWGSADKKRWIAKATLGGNGRYSACTPKLVGNASDLIPSILREIKGDGCALIGFDFPIGIPAFYATKTGIGGFKELLLQIGQPGAWAKFYDVCHDASEISLQRPFYPNNYGGRKRDDLLTRLGAQSIDDLLRVCERKTPVRRVACSLFWTLGGNQVGKAALAGWKHVLAPAISDPNVRIWPFEGDIDSLLQPGHVVIVETYPTEYYGWFFDRPLGGKRKQENRRKIGNSLLNWAERRQVVLDDALRREIEGGFPEGDDAFDAVIGLFGMLEIVLGDRATGEPADQFIKTAEGWILGCRLTPEHHH